MIGNQTKGKSFRGLLDYLSNKEQSSLIGGNMFGTNARELAREFRLSRQLGVQPGYVQNGTRCKVLLTSLQSCRLYGFDFTKTHSLDAEYMTYSVFSLID